MQTLDVRDLPDEDVRWLERLVSTLRNQAQRGRKQSEGTTFATHDSDVVGGEFERARAYE